MAHVNPSEKIGAWPSRRRTFLGNPRPRYTSPRRARPPQSDGVGSAYRPDVTPQGERSYCGPMLRRRAGQRATGDSQTNLGRPAAVYRQRSFLIRASGGKGARFAGHLNGCVAARRCRNGSAGEGRCWAMRARSCAALSLGTSLSSGSAANCGVPPSLSPAERRITAATADLAGASSRANASTGRTAVPDKPIALNRQPSRPDFS